MCDNPDTPVSMHAHIAASLWTECRTARRNLQFHPFHVEVATFIGCKVQNCEICRTIMTALTTASFFPPSLTTSVSQKRPIQAFPLIFAEQKTISLQCDSQNTLNITEFKVSLSCYFEPSPHFHILSVLVNLCLFL